MDSNLRCPYCGEPVEDAPDGAVVSCSACKKSFPRASAHDTLPSDPAVDGDPGETLPLSSAPSNLTQAFQAKRIGPYLLQSILGKGGMGAVFRARDTRLGREVAFKIMRGASTASDEARRRFQQEAVTSAKLKHPNIISIHDVGETPDGESFFVMDVVDGQTLDLWLAKESPTVTQKIQTLEKIVRAVGYAHGQGIIHRDLKPGNVVVEAGTGEPKVMDFGLARVMESASSLTESGDIVGTPAYMSPEQAEGRVRDIDERSDVYSLGAILYEMLTRKPPFEAGTVAALVAKVAHADPVSPRRLNAKVDRDLETICLKCLEKDKERRYRTAAALAEDLHRYLLGESISARPASSLYRLSKWCARHKTALAAGGAVALILVPVLILLGNRQRALEVERGAVAEELQRTEAQRQEAESTLKKKEELLKQASTKQRGVWNLVFEDDFERKEPGEDWVVSTTKDWATSPVSIRIRDGHLEFDCSAELPAFLLCRKRFARDVRMVFDAWTKEETPYDILGILYGQAAKPQSGYLAGIGLKRNTLATIDRQFKTVASMPFTTNPGQHHRFEIERRRSIVSLKLDGTPLLSYDDPNPSGIPGDRIGFSTWGACYVRIDNLKVYEYVPGLSSSPLEFAAKYFQTERYDVAAEEYAEIAGAYGGKPEGIEAEFQYAVCMLRLERFDEAQGKLEDFLIRHPQNALTPHAMFQRILCALGKGNLDEAARLKAQLENGYPGHEVLLSARDIRPDDPAYQAEILREMKLPKASLAVIREGMKSERAKSDSEYRLKLQLGEMYSLISTDDTKGAVELVDALGKGEQGPYAVQIEFWKQNLPTYLAEARRRGVAPFEYQQVLDAEAKELLNSALNSNSPTGVEPNDDVRVPAILAAVRQKYPYSRYHCAVSLVAETAYFLDRNPPKSIRAFRQLIAQYPEQTRLIGQHAYRYLSALECLGRHEEIIEAADRFQKNQDIPFFYRTGLFLIKGRALASMGQIEEGIKSNLEVLARAPGYQVLCIQALNKTGQICRVWGFDLTRAREFADRLIKEYDHAGINHKERLMARDFANDNFMRSYFDEGEYEEAIKVADKIISEIRKPEEWGSSWVLLGATTFKMRSLGRLGRWQEAAAVNSMALDRKSAFDWECFKALALLEQDNPKQALAILTVADRTYSDFNRTRCTNYMAASHMLLGEWESARDVCLRVVKESKHDELLASTYFYLELCAARIGKQSLHCEFEGVRGVGDGYRIDGAAFGVQGGILKVPRFPKAGLLGEMIGPFDNAYVPLLRDGHTFSGVRMKARTVTGRVREFRIGAIAEHWLPEKQRLAEAIVGELTEEWKTIEMPADRFRLADGGKFDPSWQIFVIYISQSNPRQDILIDDLELLEDEKGN